MLKTQMHQTFAKNEKSQDPDVILLYLILEVEKEKGTRGFNLQFATFKSSITSSKQASIFNVIEAYLLFFHQSRWVRYGTSKYPSWYAPWKE